MSKSTLKMYSESRFCALPQRFKLFLDDVNGEAANERLKRTQQKKCFNESENDLSRALPRAGKFQL